ncbi:MAG: class I SAM-dependent methyltransferase [Promethearchaeati archaeon SRVP18_Atabeyarchaeia-1]
MRIFASRKVRMEAIEDSGVATSFDRITGMPQFGLLLRLFTLKALSSQSGGRVIDIGCGGGRLVLRLAKSYPFEEVIGLDLSDKMLRLARRRAIDAGLGDRVKFKEGNAEMIPYPSGSFDLVVSTLSLHHWSRPELVFDEIARVLRPAGKCVLGDMRRDPMPVFTGLMWVVTHFIVPRSLRRAGEPLGSLQSAYTKEETSAFLQKSKLGAFSKVTTGPFWLIIKGRKM